MKFNTSVKLSKGDFDWILILAAGLIIITPFVLTRAYVTGDELFNETASLKLIYEGLNTGFLYMPNLNYYLVSFAFMAIYLFTGHLPGADATLNLGLHYLAHPESYLIGARLVSMAAGLGILLMVYLIGKRLWGRAAGVFAAMLTLLSPEFVKFSSIVSPYNTSIFFALISYYWMTLLLDRRKTIYYMMSGIFYGLSISSMYIPGLLIVPFVALHLFHPAKPGQFGDKRPDTPVSVIKGVLIFVALSTLSLVVTSPQIVLNFPLFIHEFIWRVGNTSHPEVSWAKKSFFFYFTELEHGSGLIVLLLALSGAVLLPLTHKKYDRFSLIFPVVYLLVFSMFSSKFERYILPVIPFLMLIIARSLMLSREFILKRFFREKNRRIVFFLVVLLMFMVPSFNLLQMYWQREPVPNYKHFIENWIEKDVPDNSLVIMLSTMNLNQWYTSPFSNNQNNFERLMGQCVNTLYHNKKTYFYETFYFEPIQIKLNGTETLGPEGFIVFDTPEHNFEKKFFRFGKKYNLLLKRIKQNAKVYIGTDQALFLKKMTIYVLPVHKLISIINGIKPFTIKKISDEGL